jgi:glucokinase
LILAGDIGGTKISLGVFSSSQEIRKPLVEKTYSSAKYNSLENLLREFLSGVNYPIDSASFGVAGPVLNGRSTLPNLPWVIDEEEIQHALRLPSVKILNDLVASASFLPYLERKDYQVLNAGRPLSHGAIGVIAPGTGLGEAFLTWNGMKYQAFASEGGHSDFAPTSPSQIELCRYLQGKLDHVSYERVCSGLGLREIYAYFHNFIGITEEHAKIAKALSEADDPTPVIVDAALGKVHCELCSETLNTFVSILAAEASNLALKVLATNGVYVAGGVPLHMRSALENPRFMDTFKHKGRMSKLVSDIPVYLVLNPKVGLLGAARFGMEVLKPLVEEK